MADDPLETMRRQAERLNMTPGIDLPDIDPNQLLGPGAAGPVGRAVEGVGSVISDLGGYIGQGVSRFVGDLGLAGPGMGQRQGVRESTPEMPYQAAYGQPIDPGEAFRRGAARGEFRTAQNLQGPPDSVFAEQRAQQPDIGDNLPGVDVGGLTPQQAMEKIRATGRLQPGQPGQLQPQLNPEEQFVQAQLNLQRTQLGPAERVQLQQMTNAVYQIEEQRKSGQISDLMARVMVNKFRPDMEALQARQAQTPLLQQRLAAIQLQHQNAVAGTVAQQDRAYRAANAPQEVMHAQLADGGMVSYLRRDRDGNPMPLHEQPIYGIEPWMVNPRGIEGEINRRLRATYNRDFAGQPSQSMIHWNTRAAQIDAEVRHEALSSRRLSQQQAHERRISESSTLRNRQQEQQRYDRAHSEVSKQVDKEIADYNKSRTQNPNQPAPPWMTSNVTGLTNPLMQRHREIQRRLEERQVQAPGASNEAGWNPRVQDLIEALRR